MRHIRFEMQVAATKFSWHELFAVGLLQCQDLLSLSNVMNAYLIQQQSNNNNPSQLINIADNMSKINLFIKTGLQLCMDDYEFASLKALVLFTPGWLHTYYNCCGMIETGIILIGEYFT